MGEWSSSEEAVAMEQPRVTGEDVTRIRTRWSSSMAIGCGLLAVFGVVGALVAVAKVVWFFVLFTAVDGFLAVQYARARIVAGPGGLSYRGIFRWWHLGWDRVVGFETTTLQGEGGATEHPVVLFATKSGRGPRRRRRMFAMGARSKDGMPTEVDAIVHRLNSLAARFCARET
jgi:hypothetical protein